MTNSGAVRRKLTTIFCADAQNYGALMSANEAAALDRLKTCRGLMEEQFDRHNGRLINTWGDAVIAEFSSVVESVRCAVAIQTALEEDNRKVPQSSQMQFRIGINLGDVMEDGDNVYGEGVNIAARLESLAEPGGILVSKTVYDFAGKQLALGFDYAGSHELKSGEDEIVSYRVRLERRNAPDAEVIEDTGTNNSRGDTATSDLTSLKNRFEKWWGEQPRKVRVSTGMIAMFFSINALFSGIATPWFIFPSIPFAAIILMHRRKPDTDPED